MKKHLFLLLLLLVLSCNKVLHVADVELHPYKIDDAQELEPDQAILDFIAPFKKQVDEQMNKVVG